MFEVLTVARMVVEIATFRLDVGEEPCESVDSATQGRRANLRRADLRPNILAWTSLLGACAANGTQEARQICGADAFFCTSIGGNPAKEIGAMRRRRDDRWHDVRR